MPTTYTVADEAVLGVLDEVMRANHPALTEAGVMVGVLMAENPDGDAVKHAGYPALACVKVVPLRDRVTKGYDAEMIIDLHAWEVMDDRHRAAVIDHELAHLARVPSPVKDLREGALAWKTDDLGRPRLKTRKGDWMTGDGFIEVVKRHGAFAAEYLSIGRAKAMADAACRAGEQERQGGAPEAA